MDNRAPAAAEEAALYDANIRVTALRQQLFVSEAATFRAQQLAQDLADEAELRWATEIVLREQVHQLRVELREAEARSMPAAPRPMHARLAGAVVDGGSSSSSMRDEIRALREENLALRELVLREREVGVGLRFVFDMFLCGPLFLLTLCLQGGAGDGDARALSC
jgi:hypothetical protein